MLFLWYALQAQTGVDPLSGGAGWVGAGLLGCILAWLLLKHWPASDAAREQFWKDHNKHVETLTQKFVDGMGEARREFLAELQKQREADKIELDKQRDFRHQQGNQMQAVMGKILEAIEELKDEIHLMRNHES